MYDFSRINHALILTHAVLVGLTPLIPIPFLDDWVKAIFMRRMARQLTSARGLALPNAVIDTLVQEDFWDSCVEGCLMIFLRLLRELFSKIFFWIEWRRALNMVSLTFYTGFLMDAALMDGALSGGKPGEPEKPRQPASPASEATLVNEAVQLREAIRRARYGANLNLIKHLIRPRAMLAAAWTLIRTSLAQLPRMLAALPGAFWQGLRSTPGSVARGVTSFPRRAREAFYLRVQVLLGREKAPEVRAVERLVQSMQESLSKIDPAYFNGLHARLVEEQRRNNAPPTD